MSTTASQPRHAVTAIIVAHDGARLLPALVRALRAQTRPTEQTVGVDTGSRDRSGAVLAELIGQDAVVGMHRSTGYGEAVAVGLRHAARRPGERDPRVVNWVWLLHDDCEPAPDALEKLLRAADRDRSVVVLGPKVLDGQDRRSLREVGVSIDRAGRRVTDIDPGEIDQGQHDHKRAVLAVSSAGMLVRREVWDRLGGFDPALRMFRDDVDFCWRAQAAGFRVHVVTDAVLYHRELAGRRRRPVEGGNARVLDRRNALFVLAANLPLLTMLRVVGGCVAGSLVRAAYFLLTKQLDLAAAFAFSVVSLFAHPVRLLKARHRRAAGLAEGYSAVRTFIPPARTLFRLAEHIAGLVSNGPPQASDGRHQATAEESEEDEQFVESPSVFRRVIGHPGVQLFTALLLVSLVAERRLLAANPLGGGALVPAWGGAAALWHEYLAGFHAVGVGSTASAPPYLAVVAALGTVLGNQAWLAVDVLLLGCVPLAGVTAYLATRWVVTATPARVLLAASYALLPVATGAVAAGRLGTAVAFILLPLIAVSAGRMLTAAPRRARRAAWATGLLIAVAAAFAPLTWVLGVVFAVAVLAARRWLVPVDGAGNVTGGVTGGPVNAAIVAVVPFFVLFPWSLSLLSHPSGFLLEAGVASPGLTTPGLTPTALFALSPGGPGIPPVWVTAGFGLALVAAAAPLRRVPLLIAGWSVAVAGLLAATLVSRISVTPAAGGQPADGWPGVALAVAALGLLLASAPTAQWLATIIPNGPGRLSAARSSRAAGYGRARKVLAVATLAAAATAPLLVAAYWVKDGVRGPVGSVTAPLLPAFVSAASAGAQQYRTLILRPGDSGGVDYLVVRQGDPTLGEPELPVAPAAASALSRQVAALGAPDGADAGDPGLELGSFGIRWVLLPAPVDPVLAQRLDAAVGLVALNKGPSYDLWQVAGPVGRATVVAADGATTVLSSGAVNMSGAAAPASGGTLTLAEPYGGWTATLNGRALKPLATPVDGWAQGFVLPPGGGRVSVTRNNLAREVSLIAELIVTLAIALLALPGKRAAPVAEAPMLESTVLAALREARDGRRAAGSAQRTVRPARGGGGGGGRRRRGDQEPAAEMPAEELAAASFEMPARAPIGALAEAPAEVAAAQDQGPEPATQDAAAAIGPWDMAGDWGSQTRGPAPERPALESPGPERPGPESPALGNRAPRNPWPEISVPAPSEPLSPMWGIPLPESAVWGTPLPEVSPSRGTGPQLPPWESGPQAPVAPTGGQPVMPSFTPHAGGQPPAATGEQPRSRTGEHARPPMGDQPHSGTGEEPRSRTGEYARPPMGDQPHSGTGEEPRSRTGEPPRSRTGEQSVAATGGQPGGLPPWESGEWSASADRPILPGSTVLPGNPRLPGNTGLGNTGLGNTGLGNTSRLGDGGDAPAQSESGFASGPWPADTRPEKPVKPERHSHRAKHGRPSRWRGPGNSSDRDGDS